MESLRNVRRSYDVILNSLASQNKSTEGQLLVSYSRNDRQLRLYTLLKILEELYKFLLYQKTETAISLSAATSANSRIPEPARLGGPVRPDRKATYFIAFFFGLTIPISLIVVLKNT